MHKDLWSLLEKKKHKVKGGFHKEFEENPVIFNPYASKDVPKNLFRIDQNLKIKEIDKPEQFKIKKMACWKKLCQAKFPKKAPQEGE